MALQITKSTDFGVDATYWMVTSVNLDFYHESARVMISGWTDSSAQSGGKTPISGFPFEFSGADFAGYKGAAIDIIVVTQNLIKTKADWSSAVIV